MRWEDVINAFMKVAAEAGEGEWVWFAQDREGWDGLEEKFAKFCWRRGGRGGHVEHNGRTE